MESMNGWVKILKKKLKINSTQSTSPPSFVSYSIFVSIFPNNSSSRSYNFLPLSNPKISLCKKSYISLSTVFWWWGTVISYTSGILPTISEEKSWNLVQWTSWRWLTKGLWRKKAYNKVSPRCSIMWSGDWAVSTNSSSTTKFRL